MSWSLEVSSPVPGPRLFKAALLDWHSLGPKLLPDIIVSATAIEGEGGVGSVRQFTFSPAAMPFSFVKERLDFLDVDKLELKQSLVEGGGLGAKPESASSHFKFEPTSDGGCICKVVTTCTAVPGVDITDDDVAKAKETVVGALKAAEAYLQANPGAYA